jgi:site-specific DNA recombinase
VVRTEVLLAMNTEKRLFRCAVYTRKSTEEGLEQEFNSLDAQREACEAFIRSQGGLGWKLIAKHYDDGGLSGGTMDRPALQRLLQDVKQGSVDVVVVYKIDRLTRSLMDFSKIVEVFDAHQVSFVSVTQQFNTTTSMGRLTLNVLLSSAQFEREVTAERIRDKIAASKKKGMWMGGQVPLGYDLKSRQLIVNEAEAETVRRIYELYLKLGGVRILKAEADRLGIKTKHRVLQDGTVQGSKYFSRGHLYRLLSNPIYVGRIEHHENTYPGQHEAIVDPETWDAVQTLLRRKAPPRRSEANASDIHILTGLVFDETGDRLSPTHANKRGQRYRYYISHRLMQAHRKEKDGWRLPAHALEPAVIAGLNQFLSNRTQVIDLVQLGESSPAQIRWVETEIEKVTTLLGNGTSADRQAVLTGLVTRVDLSPGQLRIVLDLVRLRGLLFEGRSNSRELKQAEFSTPLHVLDVAFALRRRGVEAKLVMDNGAQPDRKPDMPLVGLIAKAHRWFDRLAAGEVGSMEELAACENADPADISRILPLAFLAPDLVEMIVTGKQPVDFTLMKLKRISQLPIRWEDKVQLIPHTAAGPMVGA